MATDAVQTRIDFLKRNRLNLRRAAKWIPADDPQWDRTQNRIFEISQELRQLGSR
jgi:hypothetical protein